MKALAPITRGTISLARRARTYIDPLLRRGQRLIEKVPAPARSIMRREKILWLLAGLALAFAIFLRETRKWADIIALREAAGKSIKFEHEVRETIWDLGLAGLVLMGIMIVVLGLLFWRYARDSQWMERHEIPRIPAGRTFWITLLGILLLATMLRAPRMGLSLYNDEEYGFRRYVAGEFRNHSESNASVEFKPVSWARTFWYNRAGNNGYPYSVAERASYDVWRTLSGAPPGTVNEVALRLPALLAGLGSIVVIAHLLLGLGFRHGALAAALLVALHPWHVRYSTEARAYAFVILFVALTLWALSKAIPARQWRWWLLYGLFQMAYLYAFAGAVYLAVVMNVLVFGYLVVRDRRQVLPLITTNGLAIFSLLLATGPGLQQMLERLDGYAGVFQIAPSWWPDMLSYQAFGMPFFNHYPESPNNPAFLTDLSLHPALVLLGAVLVIGCIVWGSWILAKAHPCGWIMVGTVVLALPLAYLHMGSSGRPFLLWYTIDFLPLIFIAAGAGIHHLATSLGRYGRCVPALVVAGFLGVCWLPLQGYLQQPKDNFRAVVESMRGDVYPHFAEDEVLTAGFWTEAHVYDPFMTPLKEATDLERLVTQAHREQKPLYVTMARRPIAVNAVPALVRTVESSGRFEKVGEFPGLEERQYTSYVYRLIGTPNTFEAPDTLIPVSAKAALKPVR